MNNVLSDARYHPSGMEQSKSTRSTGDERRRAARGGPPLAARAAYLLAQIGRSQAAGLTERLQPLGLRPKHLALLNVVAANEGSSQQQLGEWLALEPSGIVPTIDELEAQGLLERRRDPDDRRRYALYLTPTGRTKLGEARMAAAQRAAKLFEPLDEGELGLLHDLLLRIAGDANIRPLA
jgi:DNA-binding MarR family transcriptional regulator